MNVRCTYSLNPSYLIIYQVKNMSLSTLDKHQMLEQKTNFFDAVAWPIFDRIKKSAHGQQNVAALLTILGTVALPFGSAGMDSQHLFESVFGVPAAAATNDSKATVLEPRPGEIALRGEIKSLEKRGEFVVILEAKSFRIPGKPARAIEPPKLKEIRFSDGAVIGEIASFLPGKSLEAVGQDGGQGAALPARAVSIVDFTPPAPSGSEADSAAVTKIAPPRPTENAGDGSAVTTPDGGLAPWAKTYHGPAIPPVAAFQELAKKLDDPQAIFKQAKYQQTWTLDAKDAVGKLPGTTKVMPEEMRPWAPWFRNSLKDGTRTLSFAEVLRVRTAIAYHIFQDERSKHFIPTEVPVSGLANFWLKRIDAMRKDALADAGIRAPSSTLTQLTMADAITQWSVNAGAYSGSTKYEGIWESTKVWPTVSQILARKPLQTICVDASLLSRGLIRTWEATNVASKRATGLETYSICCSRKLPGEDAGGHALTGVIINDKGVKMKLLYETPQFDEPLDINVPFEDLLRDRFSRKQYLMGPLDQASLEAYGTSYCLEVWPTKKLTAIEFGAQNPGNDIQDHFFLGNFVPRLPRGSATKLSYDQSGWRPWFNWRNQRENEIARLHQSISDVYVTLGEG